MDFKQDLAGAGRRIRDLRELDVIRNGAIAGKQERAHRAMPPGISQTIQTIRIEPGGRAQPFSRGRHALP